MAIEYGAVDDTFYFHFASNDTSGSGGDGATPTCDVRLCGAEAGAAPVYSPTPVLLTNAGYPAGAHEVAIVASVANGFAANGTYAVFCALAVDSQNPTGFVGKFRLDLQNVGSAESVGAGGITAASFGAGAIDAAAIANAAIDNATFADDVGSTAYATNIIALAVRKVLDELNLNHLCKDVTAAADMTAEVVDNTIVSRILANGDTSAFVPSTDGLQPVRDQLATVDGIVDDLKLAHILVDTTIASDGRSTTSCRLTAGSDNNDAYIGMMVVLDDDAGDGEYVSRTITDYVATNKVVTWSPAITDDAEDGGQIYVIPASPVVTSIAANAITASAIADGAIDAATFAAGAINAAAIADGAIDAATFANDAIAAAAIATGAFTADAFAADALVAATFATGAFTADAFAADAIVAATLATGALTADAFAADALVAATFATNSITADALAADAATEIVTAMLASTAWDSSATMTYGDAIETVWAVTCGNVARTGDVYVYDLPDDTTTGITITVASGTRTRS